MKRAPIGALFISSGPHQQWPAFTPPRWPGIRPALTVEAKKFKYHVCLSWDYDFCFLNTLEDTRRKQDFGIHHSDIRFLKPTEERFSFVGSMLIKTATFEAFSRCVPDKIGNLASEVTLALLDHTCTIRTIETEDADRLWIVAKTLRGHIGPQGPGGPGGPTWPPPGTRPIK